MLPRAVAISGINDVDNEGLAMKVKGKGYFELGILISLFLAISACSQSVPSEADASKIVRPSLEQFGEILDFKKTNGQQLELLGTKGYIVLVQGATRLPSGFNAINDMTGLKDVSRNKGGFLENEISLPAGTIYAFEGEVIFNLTEKGWKYDSWNPSALAIVQQQRVPGSATRHLTGSPSTDLYKLGNGRLVSYRKVLWPWSFLGHLG